MCAYSVASSHSPPGSSVHGILQARILEWVAISYSRGILLIQGFNLRLLHILPWQVDSLALVPPGKLKIRLGSESQSEVVSDSLRPHGL